MPKTKKQLAAEAAAAVEAARVAEAARIAALVPVVIRKTWDTPKLPAGLTAEKALALVEGFEKRTGTTIPEGRASVQLGTRKIAAKRAMAAIMTESGTATSNLNIRSVLTRKVFRAAGFTVIDPDEVKVAPVTPPAPPAPPVEEKPARKGGARKVAAK